MSAPPGPPPVALPPGIVEFAGPALLGMIWNWALYGVLVVQLYVYSYNFPRDKLPVKLLVYAIFLVETAQTILSGIDGYHRFASGFGNLQQLVDPYLSVYVGPILGAVVSLTIQYFFAYRVWVLSNKKAFLLCLLICTISTVDATAAFTGGIYTHIRGRFASTWAVKVLVYTWIGGNAAADILITTAMVYYLALRRNNAVVPFSNHAISRIVRLTVETNALTTTTGIVSLLLLAIYPNKIWYACPTGLLGKLYSNTLLVSLNNRIAIRNSPSGKETLPTSQSTSNRFSTVQSGLVQVEIESFQYPLRSVTESSFSEAREKVIDIPGVGFQAA